MTSEHIIQLPPQAPVYVGRQEYVVECARGKNVLHLGCTDQGATQLKFEQGILLHERVFQVAASLWGVDIDEAGLNWMRTRGYPNLYLANLENISTNPEIIAQKFDLVLISEVMEHLDNPGLVLDQLGPLFDGDTEMIITVPNSTSLTNLLYMLNGKELINPDHNYWFSFNTLKTLLNKHGFEIIHVALYTQFDYQKSLFKYFVKRIFRKIINKPGAEGATEYTPTITTGERMTRLPRIGSWLRLVGRTFIYRYLIKRNSFFADGLILVVRHLR